MKVLSRMSDNVLNLFKIALLLLLLNGCGGGGGKSSVPSVPNGAVVDLSAEATVYLDDGVILRVQEGSGQGSITVNVEASGSAGALDGGSRVVSSEFNIEAADLARGALTASLLVSLPVDASYIPSDADPLAFDVQVYNEDTKAWDWVDGWSFYDSETQDVSFWTGHFSRYRVLHSEPSDRERYNRFRVNSRNFSLTYYEPKDDVFGYQYSFAPPRDDAWSNVGRGIDTDPDIWNYVEDLDEALEDALAYYLTIRTSEGSPLFYNPMTSIDTYITYLPKKDSSGDSKFGIMRIATSLENYEELSRTGTHELAHVLSGQYYSVYGAAYNRWMFEAVADLWTSRALGMTRSEQIVFLKRTMSTYLKVPLDASDEGSYYAAADFLNWLEIKTGRPIAADVLAADYTNDLTGLNSVLSSDTSSLSDYYTEYVLQAAVGDHDFSVPLVEAPFILTETAAGVSAKVTLRHLSAKGLGVRANLDVDTLLVVTAESSAGSSDVKTYSFLSETLPVNDVTDNLESNLLSEERIVVKHFGKPGTAGVSHTRFYQIAVNSEVEDSSNNSYDFDAYVLAPPRMQTSEGRVDFTYDLQYPTPLNPVAGFNVYLGGQKLNPVMLNASASHFSHASIHSGSDVLVTVVDHAGNEWPENTTIPASNWEMKVDFNASAADISRCPRTETSIMQVNPVWIPVNVTSDGQVSFNHDWVGTYFGEEILHIEGSGTFIDGVLRVNGSWTLNLNKSMVLGISYGYDYAQQGTFTLGGHFTLGTFFHDTEALSASASGSYTRYGFSWEDNAWVADDPDHYSCSDQHPLADVTDFRQK
jgi:hypothetical protein